MDVSEIKCQIVRWLAEYLGKSGKEGFVVGMSGGVDSFALAMLGKDAAQSLGRQCLTLCLPIRFDGRSDGEDLRNVAKELGLSSELHDLTEAYDALHCALPAGSPAIVLTNLRARLRSCVLYAYANARNLLVLGTVNKAEFELGYFPKHSSVGDLLPLGDLSKRQVREIARLYGIPKEIVSRKASGCVWAENAEDEWGIPEDVVDIIIGHGREESSIVKPAEEARDRFRSMNESSEHKRHFPPIFKVGGGRPE